MGGGRQRLYTLNVGRKEVMRVRRRTGLFQCMHWILVFGGALLFFLQLTLLFCKAYDGGAASSSFPSSPLLQLSCIREKSIRT